MTAWPPTAPTPSSNLLTTHDRPDHRPDHRWRTMRPTERSEVRDLTTSWCHCQDNNLHRGLQEEAERGTRPPLHQQDYCGESQQLQTEEAQHGLQDPLQLREDPDWLHHLP
ncbi:hypothetical protein L3Q82_019024, partial [Scortum barcoo]